MRLGSGAHFLGADGSETTTWRRAYLQGGRLHCLASARRPSDSRIGADVDVIRSRDEYDADASDESDDDECLELATADSLVARQSAKYRRNGANGESSTRRRIHPGCSKPSPIDSRSRESPACTPANGKGADANCPSSPAMPAENTIEKAFMILEADGSNDDGIPTRWHRVRRFCRAGRRCPLSRRSHRAEGTESNRPWP